MINGITLEHPSSIKTKIRLLRCYVFSFLFRSFLQFVIGYSQAFISSSPIFRWAAGLFWSGGSFLFRGHQTCFGCKVFLINQQCVCCQLFCYVQAFFHPHINKQTKRDLFSTTHCTVGTLLYLYFRRETCNPFRKSRKMPDGTIGGVAQESHQLR